MNEAPVKKRGKGASTTVQRMDVVNGDPKAFMAVFTPSDIELWGQWERLLPAASYKLLRYLQEYLRNPETVFLGLQALNGSVNVVAALDHSEATNGFAAAERMNDENDTGRFLDKIALKVPLIDVAADKATGIDGVRHGRLTHRIQWYIIAHSLSSDATGRRLLAQAGCTDLADAYALSAKLEFRKALDNHKTVAPWTTMVDRPVIVFPDRLYLPDATIPENLGCLLFAGKFSRILEAEDSFWNAQLYTKTLRDHPVFLTPLIAKKKRTDKLLERERKRELRAKEARAAREAAYAEEKAALFKAALGPESTYEDSLRYRRLASSELPEI